jgi:putative hydrolase of the HAD superfamily
MCSNALKVLPKDCVFEDDQSRNVMGAIQVGWQTVHFDVTQPTKSYEMALKVLGIK